MSDSMIPWAAAHKSSLSFTISQSLLKFMPIESVMPSNHLILCYPLLLLPSVFPASGSFPMSQLFSSGGQSTGASASVLSMSIQDWFPLGLTGLISLLPNGLSKLFQHHSSKVSILCLSAKKRQYGQTLTSIYDYWKNHSFDSMDLCQQSYVSVFNMLSRFVIAFLPRSKSLLISWLHSLSTVILEPRK